MKTPLEEKFEKLVMVEYLRKTYPESFFLDPEYDLEIEGVDPLNYSILYNEIGVIHMAMHLMKDDYGYEGKVYNYDDMDENEDEEWTDYYDQIQEQIFHIFHRHDSEEDKWDGKVPPTLFHDIEFEASHSLREQIDNTAALKERATKYSEVFKNN